MRRLSEYFEIERANRIAGNYIVPGEHEFAFSPGTAVQDNFTDAGIRDENRVTYIGLDFGHSGRPQRRDFVYERNSLGNNGIELGDIYFSA